MADRQHSHPLMLHLNLCAIQQLRPLHAARSREDGRNEGGEFVRVEDVVAIALLGEKQLPLDGELLIARVARDDGVEVREQAVALRAQDAAQPLRFFLARSERARDLNRYVRVG